MTSCVVPNEANSGITNEPVGAVARSPEGPPPPQLNLPLHPLYNPGQPSSGLWTLCGPERGKRRENRRAGRSGRKKSTGSHEDALYADPSELMDSAGSDHSHGSKRAPQEVLRISQYSYIIGAEYSKPPSVSMDLEPSSIWLDPGSPVQALTPESGPSIASTRTPTGAPQGSDWDSGPYEEWYSGQGVAGGSTPLIRPSMANRFT